jgi:hypothetical protein
MIKMVYVYINFTAVNSEWMRFIVILLNFCKFSQKVLSMTLACYYWSLN